MAGATINEVHVVAARGLLRLDARGGLLGAGQRGRQQLFERRRLLLGSAKHAVQRDCRYLLLALLARLAWRGHRGTRVYVQPTFHGKNKSRPAEGAVRFRRIYLVES